ncbi:MAG TPA: bestrophin family ion channel [Candidatus Obscuribacterales bacterium]
MAVHSQLFKGLFHFSLLWRLAPIMVMVGLYSAAATMVAPAVTSGKALLETNSALFVGVILSLLLVFRTNSAYDRWWEGRRLWGQLVNDIRNASVKADRLLDVDSEERQQFGRLMIEFAHCLKDHLRQISDEKEGSAAPVASQRRPMAPVLDMYALMARWRKQDQVDGFSLLMLDAHVRSFADILGACERISLSPITLAHKSMILHMIFLYVLFLPWALAPSLGYWDVPFVAIGVYMVLGLEVVAEAKEHPFGTGEEDLPLDRLCETIRRSVEEILNLPPSGLAAAAAAPLAVQKGPVNLTDQT